MVNAVFYLTVAELLCGQLPIVQRNRLICEEMSRGLRTKNQPPSINDRSARAPETNELRWQTVKTLKTSWLRINMGIEGCPYGLTADLSLDDLIVYSLTFIMPFPLQFDSHLLKPTTHLSTYCLKHTRLLSYLDWLRSCAFCLSLPRLIYKKFFGKE